MVLGKYEEGNFNCGKSVYTDLIQNKTVNSIKLSISAQGHRQGLWRDTISTGLRFLLKDNFLTKLNTAKITIHINSNSIKENDYVAVCQLKLPLYKIKTHQDLTENTDRVLKYIKLNKNQSRYTLNDIPKNNSSFVFIKFNDKNSDEKFNLNELKNYSEIVKKYSKLNPKPKSPVKWSRENFNIEGVVNFNNYRFPAKLKFVSITDQDKTLNIHIE